MLRTMSALLLAGLAATASAKTAEPAKLDAGEAKELARALDGKVAGKPVSCVSTFRGENLRAIGDHTLVYRVSKKLIYRNDLQGTCHGLRFGDTLVLKVFGNQYCRGDIAHAVHLPTGTMSGTCALGDFVPYTSGAAG
ncbi:MAG: hypothetical protein J7498_02575 [Sphingobium sp.]|nr:hypothetical protein [Sphingobium sp.]